LADAAHRQMLELPYYNSFFQTTNVQASTLAAKLASLAPTVDGRSFQHVFYSSSGSESNDSNVRMVRRYWDLLGQPERKVIIGRINGYHGSTMAGASLGGMSGMHAQGGLPIPGIEHIEQPYWWAHGRPARWRGRRFTRCRSGDVVTSRLLDTRRRGRASSPRIRRRGTQ
jgi:putrescine aminotransferase